MQEHVELEVSLEIIMSQIAQKIFEINKEENIKRKEILEQELENLINIQEEAYKGNRQAVISILATKKKGLNE